MENLKTASHVFPWLAAAGALLMFGSGCTGEPDSNEQRAQAADNSPAGKGSEPPPIPTAAANDDPSRVSNRRLHERLKEKNPRYGGEAQFQRQQGRVAKAGIARAQVSDLSPLRGLRLKELHLWHLPVRDLGPLQGMPLEVLDVVNCPVSDVSPLAGMPLVTLYLEGTEVADAGPLKGLPLEELWLNKTRVSDVSPLEGMDIRQLNLTESQIADISVVESLPLHTLWLGGTPVDDFSSLKGLFLESLDVHETAFDNDDLKLLKGMPLLRLQIAGTQVTDLRPLAGLRLQRLIFTPGRITEGIDVVRSMSTLRHIDTDFPDDPNRLLTASEFWRRYDAGEFDERPENGP